MKYFDIKDHGGIMTGGGGLRENTEIFPGTYSINDYTDTVFNVSHTFNTDDVKSMAYMDSTNELFAVSFTTKLIKVYDANNGTLKRSIQLPEASSSGFYISAISHLLTISGRLFITGYSNVYNKIAVSEINPSSGAHIKSSYTALSGNSGFKTFASIYNNEIYVMFNYGSIAVFDLTLTEKRNYSYSNPVYNGDFKSDIDFTADRIAYAQTSNSTVVLKKLSDGTNTGLSNVSLANNFEATCKFTKDYLFVIDLYGEAYKCTKDGQKLLTFKIKDVNNNYLAYPQRPAEIAPNIIAIPFWYNTNQSIVIYNLNNDEVSMNSVISSASYSYNTTMHNSGAIDIGNKKIASIFYDKYGVFKMYQMLIKN